MASRSKVYTPPYWQRWKFEAKMWLPNVLVAVGIIGLGILTWGVLPAREETDIQGTAKQQGYGKVTSISSMPDNSGEVNPANLAWIALGTDTLQISTHAPLRQNERLKITYRVGRSGRIHIDNVEPVGETKP